MIDYMNAMMQRRLVVYGYRGVQEYIDSGTALKEQLWNNSDEMPVYFKNDEDIEKEMQAFRRRKIMQYSNEISAVISRDEYIDGEESQSEIFMKNAYQNSQMDYVLEALMQIYLNNLSSIHILEGILVMLSAVPYEAVQPKGQTMAIGLLANKDLLIRDRAIQCFEHWNSKKGLDVLRSLQCEPKWLQKYVDKIIAYIEKDGID